MPEPRYAVLTSGGDAPGMNSTVRSVVLTLHALGATTLGVRNGYTGLLSGDIAPISAAQADTAAGYGGTWLGSSRSETFHLPEAQRQAVARLREIGAQGLIVVGGNGSQRGAAALHRLGFPVVGVASTIDNDLRPFDITLGADTAVNIALESLDRLRTTATSHHRVAVVEVMGRRCGYIAWATGLAGGADVVVTPEAPIPMANILQRLRRVWEAGKRSQLVVVAEGARPNGDAIAKFLAQSRNPQLDPRLTILGHVQRGGNPSAFDRWLGARGGQLAAETMRDGVHGFVVGLRNGSMDRIAYSEIEQYPPWDPSLFVHAARYLCATDSAQPTA